jgi:hypothetical protein
VFSSPTDLNTAVTCTKKGNATITFTVTDSFAKSDNRSITLLVM